MRVRLLLPSLLLFACPPPPEVKDAGAPDAHVERDAGTPDAGPSDAGSPDAGAGFDDFTVPRIESQETFEAFAATGAGGQVVKFVITRFSDPQERSIRFMSGHAYTLHDEWYWFRLMNGQRVPGADAIPYEGTFTSVANIYAWAREQTALPLDLRWIGERLYSPRFYELALSTEPPVFGVGTLVRFPARTTPAPRDEIWAFELEYSHNVDHAELVAFFESLEPALPDDIAPRMKWLVRSQQQEALATSMEQAELPYHDRILRYSELTTPGEVQVYSPGLTAGRLRKVSASDPDLQSTRNTDVLLMDAPPDFLPPAAGLVTAVPQTPLAHINVLARNRGIPNAYLGGVVDDPHLDQLARVSAPVAIRAITPDRLDIVQLTEAQYSQYRNLQARPPLSVPPVNTTSAPYTVDLGATPFAQVESLRPLIGGKCAGFLGLLAPEDVTTVHNPLCITVRAYVEHVASMRARIQELLLNDDFNRFARTRLLALEGPDAFDNIYRTASDRAYREEVLALPQGDVLGDLVRDGGLQQLIRDTPMAPATLATITAALQQAYASYAPAQGLRFRSSSSVEDIEGFNGAGLYDSSTGYLDPMAQPDPSERDQSVEWAIKRTWASYWGMEAFEERKQERVDHLSGNMAVVVHARFDDDKELANGVFTFTILPPEHEDAAVMEVNSQKGALSVTNPPPGVNAQPEVVRLRLPRGAVAPVVERLARSSIIPVNEVVLDDAKLTRMFTEAHAVTAGWLAQENSLLFSSQRRRTLTLDFEHREMAAGWPALTTSNQFGRRLVIKQARTLEPGIGHIPQSVQNYALPRDVLARARRIERRTCTADRFRLIMTDAYTDPLRSPDLGYDVEPFTGSITLEVSAPISELGLATNHRAALAHSAFTSITHPGMRDGGPWQLEATVASGPANSAGVDTIVMNADQTYTLTRIASSANGTWTSCDRQVVYSTPAEFLLQFLPAE